MLFWHILTLLIILKLVPTSSDKLVSPSCEEFAEICYIHLVVSYNFTMTRWQQNDFGKSKSLDPVEVTEDEQLRVRQHCQTSPPLTFAESQNVQLGDGTFKKVILFNGQLPGPSIVIYENQQVVVEVVNKLTDEPITVHWHGLRQVNTPWMDGAGSVSQCPIPPFSSFTYRFIANPVGTHWYHSHQTSQRTMGAYGPLIVLPRNRTLSKASLDSNYKINQYEKPREQSKSDDKKNNTKQIHHSKDHIMMISDWFQQSSLEILNRLRHEFYKYGYSDWVEADNCYIPSKNVDGVEIGMQPYYAGLINGKGYSSNPMRPPTISEVFHVTSGEWHRFRVINTGMFYFLRVSMDHHDLHVTSTDGSDLHPAKVESVIIGPGERFDIEIFANDPLKIGSYTIRVETTEYYYNTTRMEPHSVTAILHYQGTEIQKNLTKRQECTAKSKCRILNCPFRSYGEEDHIDCIPLTELTSTKEITDPHLAEENDDVLEIFLRLQFTGADDFGAFKPTINGILHRPHTTPPQIYPPEGTNSICEEPDNCPNDACHCTHELHVPLGQIVQMVVYTHLPPFTVRSVIGTAHTIHLHGYQFEVTKIGWPNYSEDGKFSKNTDDITCDDNDKEHEWTCHSPTWTNTSWSKMSHRGPHSPPKPFKDTVLVPAGGYVVLRFRADNPGFWLFHCHMEIHNEMGMAMVLRTGNESQMTRLPKHFQTCGGFDWSSQDFKKRFETDLATVDSHFFQISSVSGEVALRTAFVILIFLALLATVMLVSHVRPRFTMTMPCSLPCMEDKHSVGEQSSFQENSPLCSSTI